jgi:hypothetical protein
VGGPPHSGQPPLEAGEPGRAMATSSASTPSQVTAWSPALLAAGLPGQRPHLHRGQNPLDNLQVTLGGHIQTRPRPPLDSTGRLLRRIGELGQSLAARQRAIPLICFLYDNPGFKVQPSRHHATVKAQVSEAIRQGVEIWQVNFRLDATGVRVLSHHELTRLLSA